MIRSVLPFLFLFSPLMLVAQGTPSDISLDKQSNLYLVHTVGAKENFYSIGRIYNISPKLFAPYNGLDLEKSKLSIGQTLNIPLNSINFWQTGTRTEKEAFIPLYYKLSSPADLSSLAKQVKGSAELIRSWNQLQSDQLKKGDRVIIGYLKVDKVLSPLASTAVATRTEPELKVVASDSVKYVAESVQSETKPTPVEQKKSTVGAVENKKNELIIDQLYSGEGVFKQEYEEQVNHSSSSKTDAGTVSTFVSTSGWTNGKYYLLISGIEKGTVVLVKHITSGKFIYAKVLGTVQEIKPDASDKVMISAAAADQLGINANDAEIEWTWPEE